MSFEVPWPPDYGGITDVYWKLYWLHKAGIRIHLHCFTSKRPPAREVEELCEETHYYKRKTGFAANLSLLPYTVVSRKDEQLGKILLTNDYPILFEVLHTCHLIADKRFSNRMKVYRHSNIEHRYYSGLAKSEKSLLKKLFFRLESMKLKRFERVLNHANVICAVNSADAEYFRKKFPNARTWYIPSFHAHKDVSIKSGKGDFVLFHGNLSVSENYDALLWLAENVFPLIECRVVVAGLNPPPFVSETLQKQKHVTLLSSPAIEEMSGLIADAQVHVLYTAQPTGLKLKLLNVLFTGRFVVCNPYMLAGTGLLPVSSLLSCNTPSEFVSAVHRCMATSFTAEMEAERRSLVAAFTNERNTATLIEAIQT